MPAGQSQNERIAIDIGSTVIKVARVGSDDRLLGQQFHARDMDAGIARQVESLLTELGVAPDQDNVLVCSSANGGLRVGILCLTTHFSGSALRNQVLLAGANPVYVHDLDHAEGNTVRVDILLVGGGIDCKDTGPLERRLKRLALDRYCFASLIYCGNTYLAGAFLERFPQSSAIPNPLAGALTGGTSTVFEAVRRAYLDDLVYKEGISELRANMARGVRPTPEVVNSGFHRAVSNRSSIDIAGPCILLDIGGATTDIHYTVEVVRDESNEQPSHLSSVARYVFTDLGIVASRDSLMLQLRTHPRLYEFLEAVLDDEIRDAYRLLREGDYAPSPALLSYGCIFLALDRFGKGHGPGLPTADLRKAAQIILTGGAAQSLAETVVGRVVGLLLSDRAANPVILIDGRYQIWVDGITWSGHAPS